MTTPDEKDNLRDEEKAVRFEWDVTPPPGKDSKNPIEFYDALRTMMKLYEPVENEADSNVQFTTAEIVQALETHYLVPQGESSLNEINGESIVDYLYALGFRYVNTGGLMLQWIMKRK